MIAHLQERALLFLPKERLHHHPSLQLLRRRGREVRDARHDSARGRKRPCLLRRLDVYERVSESSARAIGQHGCDFRRVSVDDVDRTAPEPPVQRIDSRPTRSPAADHQPRTSSIGVSAGPDGQVLEESVPDAETIRVGAVHDALPIYLLDEDGVAGADVLAFLADAVEMGDDGHFVRHRD